MPTAASLLARCVVWLLLLAATALPAAAQVPVLRLSAVVDRDTIKAGDVFQGLSPQQASIDIAHAPAPGQRVSLDVTFLQSIANSLSIGWKPSSRLDRAVVERAAQILGTDDMRPLVLAALQQRGLSTDADILFDNEQARIFASTGRNARLSVDQMVWDAQRGRFTATFAIIGDPVVQPVSLQGRVFQVLDVAVPNRVIQPGETIRARDLQTVRLRTDQVGRVHVTEMDRLVGRAARRLLVAGQPVRAGDVQAPILVTRNGIVTVRLAHPTLALAMQGKALDDGAEGDSVRIVNPRSNKTIQGVVTGPGEVTVPFTGPQVATTAPVAGSIR
ncbi:MAG: flagella basal body P-ring formation protein FlgA [Alphaproteobacteria bacterium]|nr:flagellar basal body P-ring formation chaperone FlgA [Alphaproteobacteria bacterium]TAD88067.1 MAG: flagella basal body P-ring formation protein FlgA [Alphaproteobacteria bacterium]